MWLQVKNGCLVLAFLLHSVALFSQQKKPTKNIVKPNDAVYLSEFKETIFSTKKSDTAAFLLERKKQIDSIINNPLPVKFYTDKTDERTILAQQIALQDTFFVKYIFDRKTHQPLWNEIFGVYPARPGDIRKGVVNLPGSLMRIEMYNYALNLTTIGIVNVITHKMISVDHYPQMQPDIPSALTKLAVKIAINSP